MKNRVLASTILLLGLIAGVYSSHGQISSSSRGTPENVLLTPFEIDLYRNASTVIDWNPHKIKEVLHKLRPAENQDQLSVILAGTGEAVSAFLHNIPRIACDEEVDSDSYQSGVTDSQHHKFRYIVIPHPEDAVPTFEEYRSGWNGESLNSAKYRNLPLVTYGFTSTVLLLSPSDQREEKFRYFGIQVLHDRECHVLGFAQIPEKAHRVGRFSNPIKTCATLLQGLVWVDTKSFDIVQLDTWLLARRSDVALRDQESRVEFAATPIAGSKLVLDLPKDVKVGVAAGKLFAHNTHTYSNYKLFVAESAIKPIP
jgi:hypothetical protein